MEQPEQEPPSSTSKAAVRTQRLSVLIIVFFSLYLYLHLRSLTGNSGEALASTLAIAIVLFILIFAVVRPILGKSVNKAMTTPAPMGEGAPPHHIRKVLANPLVLITFIVAFGFAVVNLPTNVGAGTFKQDVAQILLIVGLVGAVASLIAINRKRTNPGFLLQDTSKENGFLTEEEVSYVNSRHDKAPYTASTAAIKMSVTGMVRVGKGAFASVDIEYGNSFAVDGHFFEDLYHSDAFMPVVQQLVGQEVTVDYVKDLSFPLKITQRGQIYFDATKVAQ